MSAAEIEQRQTPNADRFFVACAQGDVEVLGGLLVNDASLVRLGSADRPHQGWTGLHAAAQHGQVGAVRLLLQHGAEPNAREAGDNTYALHWAAAGGHIEVVRALLDVGADVHGIGDVHELDVIGWATLFQAPGKAPGDGSDVVSLLLARGARHHVFSAIAVGDLGLIRRLVEQDPAALDRRMSRFEDGQTPLHFALDKHRYDILDLLLELGADREAEDKNGHSPLMVAMLRGDGEAMRRLHAAGAQQPEPITPSSSGASMARMADFVRKGVPMIGVPDVAATLDWYASIGFKEMARFEDDGVVSFGMVSFGKAELMLVKRGETGRRDVSLWLYTDQVEELYELFKSRQLEAARAMLAGAPGDHQGIEFVEYLNEPFYGGRQFGIRDPNGFTLYFRQPAAG